MKRVPRRRRTPEQARREILDAAERALVQSGPAGIRIKEVAREVGISHPAILHHFGSRDALVQAVVDRVVISLQVTFVQSLAKRGTIPTDGSILERMFEALGSKGHARLIAWLVLAGHDPLESKVVRANWSAIAKETHALRVKAGSKATLEDTKFTMVTAALAIFGEAIAGGAIFKSAQLTTPGTRRRFRQWLAALLGDHMLNR